MNNRYDEWGNLIERKTFDSHQHFDYDAENRLIKAYGKGPQGQHVTYYYYDGLGRRTSKQVTRQDSFSSRTETTTFLWQGLRLLQEHSPACFYSYLYEPNDDYSPLARINHNSNSNSIEYYHSEVNGQPLELTDSDGTILWSATYNSWGKLLRLNQINDREGRVFGIEQPLRYAGQYADNETGLHYNTFRYYDPEIGRFTQQDPIGLLGGTNLYAYVPNPLIYVDPLGLAFSGVNFSGSSDLFPIKGNQSNIVEITMQGSRSRDFTEAFKLAGITKSESAGYTWHHLNDFDPQTGKTTMQLVKTSAHEATFPHAGSVSQFEEHFNLPSGSYGSSDAIAIPHSKAWLNGRVPKTLKAGC